MLERAVAGTVTSGEWGHRTGLNLALAFVKPRLAVAGSEIKIDILGEWTTAKVIPPSPFDPDMLRPRA
jgi:dimethylglycine dehydrogenase